MKQRLLQLLLNPFVIAGFISVAIIYFLPDYFSKYKVDLVNQELKTLSSVVYFNDLDGDGKSEKIIAQPTQDRKIDNASYLLYSSNGDFVDQFNLDRPFCNDRKLIGFNDGNNDGYKEIYIPTKNVDTAFLNVHEPLQPERKKRNGIFIDVMNEFNNEYEFRLHSPLLFENITNQNADFMFSISNGFAANPRSIYKYDYTNNVVLKSPHLTNSTSIYDIQDIDDDGNNEILISNNAAGNTIDSVFTKRSDYSAWLAVLDDDLSFLFEPIEIKCLGSIHSIPIKLGDKNKFIANFNSRQYKKMPSNLIRLSVSGKIEKEKIVAGGSCKLFNINNNIFARYELETGHINVYDNDLNLIKEFNIKPNCTLYYYDVDADTHKEWIVFHVGNQRISIYRSDFLDEITFDLGFTPINTGQFSYGIKQVDASNNQLYFQNRDDKIIEYYKYHKNPNYIYGYLIYPVIYGLILAILLLVTKGQKLVEARKRAIEQEISELQLKTIKNQVDPHFVFNAINTISEMTLTDNKLEADKFISRFSGFMRDTLNQSDKISTTLKDELDYTENFIRLQQIRFNNSFDYKIDVDKGVNKSTKIPKHVLFTYVENAIKHGLSYTRNGLLKITASKNPEYLLLAIEDNGGGIEKTDRPKKHSTGSGLKIMDDIFELYSKLYKRKISHKLIELWDENKNKTGIRVEIKISRPKK